MLQLVESQEKSVSRQFHFPRSSETSPLAAQEIVDLNTRADLRIDFITKSCDNDS